MRAVRARLTLGALVFVFIVGILDQIEALSRNIIAAAESRCSCVVKDILVNKDSVYVQNTSYVRVTGMENYSFVSGTGLKLSGFDNLWGALIERRGKIVAGKKTEAAVAPQQIGLAASYIYYREINSNFQIADVDSTEISDSQQWSMRRNELHPPNSMLLFDNIGLTGRNEKLFLRDLRGFPQFVDGGFHIFGLSFAGVGSDYPQSHSGEGQYASNCYEAKSDEGNRIVRYPLPEGFAIIALIVFCVAGGLTLLDGGRKLPSPHEPV